MTEDFSHISRVHIITPGSGPNPEFWADHWLVALQDEGLTLKLFGAGDGQAAKAARDAALAQDFSQHVKDHRWWHWHKHRKGNNH